MIDTQAVTDERLKVIGQIEVVRARLDALKKVLVAEPYGGTNLAMDEVGNLSFQTGILIGAVGLYQDAVRAAQPKEPTHGQ